MCLKTFDCEGTLRPAGRQWKPWTAEKNSTKPGQSLHAGGGPAIAEAVVVVVVVAAAAAVAAGNIADIEAAAAVAAVVVAVVVEDREHLQSAFPIAEPSRLPIAVAAAAAVVVILAAEAESVEIVVVVVVVVVVVAAPTLDAATTRGLLALYFAQGSRGPVKTSPGLDDALKKMMMKMVVSG